MSRASPPDPMAAGTGVRPGDGGESRVRDYAVTSLVGPRAGERWLVASSEASRTYVGSSEACRIRVADGLVSRRHASLVVVPGGLRIEDLGSTNGTWVDTVRIGSALLQGGETLSVGDTKLRIDAVGEARPAPAPTMVRFGKMLGASVPVRRLYPLLHRIAQSDVPVLIEGETGTGKEVVAESIHSEGSRAKEPFVIFDCTTVAPTLLEATLFGYEKGAFTGAVSSKPGVFELAQGGTLFIDEIGDLDINLQAKLLRAIQSSQVQRVGGTKWIQTNVRIISATRRDLEREIQAGTFRDDLFFRLVVARLELPPLRERTDDIPLLARAFWAALGGDVHAFPDDLLAGLADYPWPGNVRELHNLVAKRLALGDLASMVTRPRPSAAPPPNVVAGSAVGAGDIIDRVIAERQPFARARERVVYEFERRYTEWALSEHGGNVQRAAEASGIGRRYFYVIRSRSGG